MKLIYKIKHSLASSKVIVTRVLHCLFIGLLIVGCAAEKKPSIDNNASLNTDTPTVTEVENVESTTIDNTVDILDLPADEIEEPKIVTPKELPPLTQKQLFADTLGAHNRVRAKHGLNPLKWSAKLTQYSQEWADRLGSGNSCKMYHRPGLPPYGENLYISTAERWFMDNQEVSRKRNRVTVSNVVKAWADEEQWYNYQSNNCQRGKRCGHYTQIVWRNTTEVGCAVKYCGDESQVWVCSYNPPGNFKGVRPY